MNIMALRQEILCVNKSYRFNLHERILWIGGKDPDGSRWKISQLDAILGIEEGKWEFFVHREGHEVDVIVARSFQGNKYLKTTNDGSLPDNLLSLPECA